MKPKRASLADARRLYARLMAAASGSDDPRIEAAFASVPREDFLGPGPWQACAEGQYFDTPTADPVHLYQDILVALDPAKRINNGQPTLHAAWIGAAAPQPGETVCQIGAGTGYYTAILATLVRPGGRVVAFEIDAKLARRARDNLAAWPEIEIVEADASGIALPACDIVYVNAGVAAPPESWLAALRAGGRMIFPWRPAERIGIALLLTRAGKGFAVRPLMPSWFIPCVGASDASEATKVPDLHEAWRVHAAWRTQDRAPDESAVAIYPRIWFSSEAPSATAGRSG